MTKHGVPSFLKGVSTCSGDGGSYFLVDTRQTESVWSSVRNNANNSWNVNLGTGNMNNNNTYNRNVGCAVSELGEEEISRLLDAEEKCYKNKHDSIDAQYIHYNLRKVADLAKELRNGTWEQGTAIVFGITYPTLREVWAAAYTDRILHHDVAPIIIDATERIHERNNNVSHGNRTERSSFTAAMQIMENMRMFKGGFVAKRDISGFFMSINKKRAYDIIHKDFSDHSKDELIYKLLLHNPTKNCELHSPQELLDKIPKNKSLFNAKEGYGFPIGNFYSQLVANAYLEELDALHLSEKWNGRIGYTRFVDDVCVVTDSPKTANEFFNDAADVLAGLELRFNAHKNYMQPIRHGVDFCGYVVHEYGIYIRNRTRNACKHKIEIAGNDYMDADRVVRSLNSYFGFFSHCKAWNIQKDIAKMVYEKYGAYTQQYVRHGQIVFRMAYKYSEKGICENNRKIYLRNLNRRLRERRKVMFNL